MHEWAVDCTMLGRNILNLNPKPMVFNLFHAATHFATQFNLTTPSENLQSGIWTTGV